MEKKKPENAPHFPADQIKLNIQQFEEIRN